MSAMVATRNLRRDELRAAIVGALRASEQVLAIWEAGSAARGRVDRYSDLDLGVLITAGGAADAWRRLDRTFARLGGVALRWREPDPVFKGIEKRTYRLRRAGRWLQLDVGLFTAPAADLFNQRERHGEVVVLHDPTGALAAPAWDAEARRRELRIALHHLVMRFELYREFHRKELARGRTIDAFRMYSSFIVHSVVSILGMLHRPARWDFGLRYVHDELPPDAAAVVERLCYVGDPEALAARAAEGVKVFRRTLGQLARRGITPLDPGNGDVGRVRRQ